jgi:integrase
MGEILKRGDIWWIRYSRNGQRFAESARTRKRAEAAELLKLREGDIAKGLKVSPKMNRLRFEDAAQDIVAEYTINGRSTLAHVVRRLKLHLTPFFGYRRMAEITTADVRAFTQSRLKVGAANAEINRELAVLKRMYSLAIKGKRLHSDGRPDIPMLAEHNVRRGFFERAQFDAIKRHLSPALQPLVEFAYLTGWRVQNEIVPLEWRQVDWNGRVVTLDPGTTKNNDGRSYPITAALDVLLRAQLAEHDRLKTETGRIVPQVFHRNGRAIRNFTHAWRSACAAAGLPGRHRHDFRRTAVRNLERTGVPRSAAMAMVGHKTESIYRRYAIVDAGTLREAAARIDRAAGAPATAAGKASA